MIRRIRAFCAFWYDFIVGDDWLVALGVTLALAITFAAEPQYGRVRCGGSSSWPSQFCCPSASFGRHAADAEPPSHLHPARHTRGPRNAPKPVRTRQAPPRRPHAWVRRTRRGPQPWRTSS